MNVKLNIQLNLWKYWISATVEIDENVKRDKTIDTTEFVTILNKWNCWIRWECKTRSDYWICDTVLICGTVEWD